MNVDLAAIGTFLVAILGGGGVVAVINVLLNPKAKAETRQIAEATARTSMQTAIDTLRTELRRVGDKADAAEARADEADEKVDRITANYRIVVDQLWRLQSWARRYYEHDPKGVEPPPLLEKLPEL